MSTDVKESQRRKERELWLLLIGAGLTGNKGILGELSALEANDAKQDELIGLLAGLKSGDREQVWSWLERFGVQKSESGTCIQGVMAVLKAATLKRACVQTAQALNASSLMENPEAFVEFAETHLAKIKARL